MTTSMGRADEAGCAAGGRRRMPSRRTPSDVRTRRSSTIKESGIWCKGNPSPPRTPRPLSPHELWGPSPSGPPQVTRERGAEMAPSPDTRVTPAERERGEDGTLIDFHHVLVLH